MHETRRMVELPDGQKALEIETVYDGEMETQAVFTYYHPISMVQIDKRPFKKDYWGKVEDLKHLEGR